MLFFKKEFKSQLAKELSELIKQGDFKMSKHTAKFGNGVELWLSNRPYKDMHIDEPVEVFFCNNDRRMLRDLFDEYVEKKLINLINNQ